MCAITLIPKLRSDRNPSSYKLFLAFAQNHVLLHPPTPLQTPTTTVVKFVVHKCLNHLIHVGTYTSLYCSKNKTIARKEKQKFRENKTKQNHSLTHSITRRKIKKDHCNSHGKGKEKGDGCVQSFKSIVCIGDLYITRAVFFCTCFQLLGILRQQQT